jgi:hypothetical protein
MSKKLIWWFSMSIVATIALVVGLSVVEYCPRFFCKPATPNYYAEFLTILKKMEDRNPDPNKKEDCPEPKPSSPTEKSLPSLTAECSELRTMVPNEEIEQHVDNLRNKESLAVSLMFVSVSEVSSSEDQQTPEEWAKKNLAISKTATFQDIVDKRNTVRERFDATFQKVAENSKGLGDICKGVKDVHGSQDPYWSLACTVVTQVEKAKADQKLQQPKWETLPFFNYYDVLRVKYLLEVADTAKELKVIADKRDATVLDKLCLLDKEKENIRLGITYEMNEANKGDDDVEKMTDAVMKFVGEVKTIANCRP